MHTNNDVQTLKSSNFSYASANTAKPANAAMPMFWTNCETEIHIWKYGRVNFFYKNIYFTLKQVCKFTKSNVIQKYLAMFLSLFKGMSQHWKSNILELDVDHFLQVMSWNVGVEVKYLYSLRTVHIQKTLVIFLYLSSISAIVKEHYSVCKEWWYARGVDTGALEELYNLTAHYNKRNLIK